MDAQRRHLDHDERQVGPKLTTAGRLSGTLNGLPVEILGERGGFTVRVASIYALFRLRKALRAGSDRVLGGLQLVNLPLRVQAGERVALDVSPRPHPLVRWAL